MAKFRLTPGPGFVPAKRKEWQPKEAVSQAAVFDWAKWAKSKYPDLELMYSIPNGIPIHGPQRFAIINSFKQQGMKAGLPDIALPVARGGYFSKWVEMKVRGGKLSEAQEWWKTRLTQAGASVSVCESLEQAIAALEQYCRLPATARNNGNG